MNKRVLTLTVLSSLLFSTGSLAGPTAEIKVIGEVITPNCEVAMANNGVVDYGNINYTLAESTRPVSLGAGNSGGTVTVKCDAETPLTFKVTDNRRGTASVAGTKNFGLGNVNTSGKLGYYTVKAMFPMVDGKDSHLFATTNNTVTTGYSILDFEDGKTIGWKTNDTPRDLSVGKEFSFIMVTEAFLAKLSDMHGGISEDTKLDGSTTLEFAFGL